MKSIITFVCILLLFLGTIAQTAFKVGDRVEANWLGKGTYYSGKIAEVDGEKYHIHYDDGDKEWTTAGFMKAVVPSLFNVGDRLEGDWKGTYLPCEVKKVKDGLYYVKYDDGNLDWVAEDKLRPSEGSKCADKTTKYKKDEKVDLLYSGKWYDATVLEVVGDGEYLVHYDGWDAKWDEYVCNDRLQARTTKEESTGPKSGSGNTSGSYTSETKTGTIKLQNLCSHPSIMRVGDKDYKIEAFKYIEVPAEDQTWVSTVQDGSPRGKQLYFVEDKVLTFYAMCD